MTVGDGTIAAQPTSPREASIAQVDTAVVSPHFEARRFVARFSGLAAQRWRPAVDGGLAEAGAVLEPRSRGFSGS
jgi:hypothetical protein